MFDNKEEMEELVEMVIDMADKMLDKMIESGTPKKVAKLARAYQVAFMDEGFSQSQSNEMVTAVLRSQSLYANKS